MSNQNQSFRKLQRANRAKAAGNILGEYVDHSKKSGQTMVTLKIVAGKEEYIGQTVEVATNVLKKDDKIPAHKGSPATRTPYTKSDFRKCSDKSIIQVYDAYIER